MSEWLSADGKCSARILDLLKSHLDLMKQTFVTFVRTTVVLGVVLLLPILAMPDVLDRLETMLYGREQTLVQTAESQRPNGSDFNKSSPGIPRLSLSAEPAWDAAMLRRPPLDPNPTLINPPAVYSADVVPSGRSSQGEVQDSLPVAETNQLAAIQERLQVLGAHYLRLEQVSSEPPVFRFVCHVELPGNTAYSRPFEAVAESPLEAAAAIVAEVESWRAESSAK